MNRELKYFICCKGCNKRLLGYTLTGDENADVGNGLSCICERCDKVITFKKMTEKQIMTKSKLRRIGNNSYMCFFVD